MALDVHLSRDVDEPWGFELFGGADEEMPLTIQKIEPDSPAKRAGLLNGDTILTINGEEAIDLSLEAACRRVDKCEHSLTIGVLRGLYDPVLDDQEPLYDYEPESLGQQSEPTEVVFKIQQFLEPSDIGSNLLEYDATGTNIPLTEFRSLTSSPFVTPAGPYRPFSTEPILEVPPLEDPIILNPNYRDEFGKSPLDSDPDYILNAHYKNGLGCEGKYKLPISEQYDPDGTRFKQSNEVVEKLLKYEKTVKSLSKNLEVVDVTKETKVSDTVTKDVNESLVTDVKTNESKGVAIKESLKEDVFEKKGVKLSEEVSKHAESVKKDSKSTEKKEMFTEEIEEESIKEELKYIEKMRQEIDLEKIEETALSVVEDSIERAVSVTEEIKKEMEEELSSSEAEHTSEKVSKIDQDNITKSVKSEKLEETTEIREYDDRKMSREETFETEEEASRKAVRKDIKESDISEKVSKKDGKVAVARKSLISEEHEHEEIREEPRRKESTIHESFEGKFEKQGEFKKVTKTVTAGTKSDKGAEHRAYTIGLQTIPNIRGVVHSSYHYDLLLRTFFIHLTDVMVALSRFVLTQPIFNQLETSQETTHAYESGERNLRMRKSSQEVIEKVERKSQEAKTQQERKEVKKPVPVKEVKEVSQKIEKDLKVELHEKKIEKKEIIKPIAVKQEVKIEKVEANKEQKAVVKEMAAEKKTGAQMAQRSEKKLSKEITQKMDAVISEFQTIAVEEDVKKELLQRNRRSSSRSQIEEEVMKESDPLEWLSKVDSRRTSQERTEISKKEFSSLETMEKKSFVESKQEIKHKKSKTPKQIYVAICEAHVYTNKDAIFEEQVADFSETSSVQSAEEINTAIEAVETVSTENVALDSAIRELKTAKIVEESSHELAKVTAESAATVQKMEEVMHESKELIQAEFKKETAIQSRDIQEVLIQETKEIVEPVVEMKETKSEVKKVAIDINESLTVAESTEVSIQESKKEFSNVEMKAKIAAIVEEKRALEKVVESKVEILEPKPIEIIEITETVKVKPGKKDVQDEYAALKIIKKVEAEGNLSPEIIEVEDVSELISKSVVSKVGVDQQLEIDSSKQVTEQSFISSEIGMAKSASKQESVVDISKASQMSSQVAVSSVKKELEMSQKLQSKRTISESVVQESSITAKSDDRKLSLRMDLERQTSVLSPPSTIDTPTPSTVPPTPLTDEYVFKLSLPLPRSRSATPVPRDSTLSPEDEDPHIVKKKLVPHIETTIDRVIYDPPLPTPPADKVESPTYNKPLLNGGANNVRYPVYTKPGLKGGAKFRLPVYRKPGLFGGADDPKYHKEEIREIERKSSLLASAIDETIKSIEEYKEEVGIETKKEVKVQEFKDERVSKSYQESYSKKIRTDSIQNGFEEIDTKIEEIMEQCEALAAFDNVHTDEKAATIEEIDAKEISTAEIKKENIEIESINDNEFNIKNSEEKIVKFDTKVQIIEVDSVEDKIEPEVKEKSPEMVTVFKTRQDTPVIEVRKTEIEEEIVQQKANTSEIRPELSEPAKTEKLEEKSDPLLGFRPVVFDPEGAQKRNNQLPIYQEPAGTQELRQSPYISESGELIGTIQGIVDGLEEPVMDEEVAKAIGKPGISDDKIATLISGEAEMLREAHVMGLSRVLTSHMHRADDSSVDFQKIKPMIDSLKDSEVLKALNEELARQKAEEKKKEEKKWTTFLQKPMRPVPKAKFGYHGWTEDEQIVTEPYKVKIIKQAKPKVAPDYKPEDFETGPLPWEERAVTESLLPPVEPEEPILIPEVPEFLEAVDPLKESEVPDLEDTGIPLPPPRDPTPPPIIEEQPQESEPEVQEVQEEVAQQEEEEETREEMDNKLAQQLVKGVQGMVDPNASIDQQLAQMRAQLAALAQLPEVIQQSLELVSKQLTKMTHQEARMDISASQNYQQVEVIQNHTGSEMQTIQEGNENIEASQNEADKMTIEEVHETEPVQQNMVKVNPEMEQQNMVQQEMRRVATPVITEEEMKREKQKKEQARIDHESRQVKQHPTPRVAPTKAKRMFGPLDPDEARAVVLPGGRRWRNTKDVYDEQKIAETLQAHSELIQGKTMGINFMKYEKPPVTLDHLKHSEVYKLVHDMDQAPLKRVEMRTPVMCEADYRERCRSMTPSAEKKHLQIPQQFHP